MRPTLWIFAVLLPALGCATPRAAAVETASRAANDETPSAPKPPAVEPDASTPYIAEVAAAPITGALAELRWPPRGLVLPKGDATCQRVRHPLGTSCRSSGPALPAVLELTAAARREQRWNVARRGGAELATATRTSLALAELEGCRDLPNGLVRLLRARLLPECAEELASPALGPARRTLEPETHLALYGAALGGALARLPARVTAAYRGDYSADRLERFIVEQVEPWYRASSAALDVSHGFVRALPAGSYGRLLATHGVAIAEQRLFTQYRGWPTDPVLKKSYTSRTAYYERMDRAAEPARARAIAAAFELARELGTQGSYGEQDFTAHELMRFGGSTHFLDRLAVPELPRSTGNDDALRRAAELLPIWMTTALLSREQRRQPAVLTALLHQGLPRSLVAELSTELASGALPSELATELHLLLAHGLVRLGLVTRERRLFERALLELSRIPGSATALLLGATAATLARTGSGEFVLLEAPTAALDLSAFARAPEERNAVPLLAYNGALLGMLAKPWETLEPERAALRRLVDANAIAEEYQRCVREFTGHCRYGWNNVSGPSCTCVSWPWRAPASP